MEVNSFCITILSNMNKWVSEPGIDDKKPLFDRIKQGEIRREVKALHRKAALRALNLLLLTCFADLEGCESTTLMFLVQQTAHVFKRGHQHLILNTLI